MIDENKVINRILIQIVIEAVLTIVLYRYPNLIPREMWLFVFFLVITSLIDAYEVYCLNKIQITWIQNNKKILIFFMVSWILTIFFLGIYNLFLRIGDLFNVLVPVIIFLLVPLILYKERFRALSACE